MKKINLLIIQIFICLCMVTTVLAAVPSKLSYQGILTDKSGVPVSASKVLDFRLYDVASGGVAIWAETQTVAVTNGRFGVVLGSDTPLEPSIFTGNTWMGIAVQGEPEMTPRQQLTSVAYAMTAGIAESVPSAASLPSGMVVAFAGTSAPAGWLPCDGAQVSRSEYADLFSSIGTAHGTGDGSTTFNLPDYRGRFLRGVDGAAGNDFDSAIAPVFKQSSQAA